MITDNVIKKFRNLATLDIALILNLSNKNTSTGTWNLKISNAKYKLILLF